MSTELRVNADELITLVKKVFMALDVPEDDAFTVADNLVAADLRGVRSHGVARLERYVKGIKDGLIKPVTKIEATVETSTTATLHAHDGLGQVAGKAGMELAIKKAKENGTGFVAVRNSNHYGIAAYYTMMALEHDLIGISMTNSAPLVVPTFAREIFVGTNPISVAVPTGKELPYVLDMATSTAPRGKVEVYNREEKPLPDGWATDATGKTTDSAGLVLDNLINRKGGGLLPLGGEGEIGGGHKGYGLSFLVDILSGVLSGGAFGNHLYEKKDGQPQPANVGHFFGAIDIKGFIGLDIFKATMDRYIQELKDLPKAEGAERIYIHGEKEYENTEELRTNGVFVHPKSVVMIRDIAKELGVPSTILD